MTFELLTGIGLLLPENAGTLRFGMTEHEAQWTASTLENVRAGGWLCGTHWNFTIHYRDIQVTAYSSADRSGRTLDHLIVERTNRQPEGPADVPVAFGDINVFGYPIHELAEVIDPADRQRLWPKDVNPLSTRYLTRVFLDTGDGRP